MSEPILRISSMKEFPPLLRGSVVVIGNFDGVHRAHQSVLEQAKKIASPEGLAVVVLTFEPHPRDFFAQNQTVFRLTPPAVRARILETLGVSCVVEMPFDAGFSQKTADEFIEDILVKGLGAKHVVAGYDFHFGAKRQGTPDYLAAQAKKHGFSVSLSDVFTDEAGVPVSSSRVRDYLRTGDVGEAAGLLGYYFKLESRVVAGQKLGRTLGYPTANMAVDPTFELKTGIYAVQFKRLGKEILNGVASFGRRPTVEEDGRLLLETFIFDFSENIYGENCEVTFISYLRGEERFENLEDLTTQMKVDESEARTLLAAFTPTTTIAEHVFNSNFD